MDTISLITSEIDLDYFEGSYYCYGCDARIMFGLIGWNFNCHRDESYLGASFVMPKNSLDIVAPKVVKAGYKLRIKNQ